RPSSVERHTNNAVDADRRDRALDAETRGGDVGLAVNAGSHQPGCRAPVVIRPGHQRPPPRAHETEGEWSVANARVCVTLYVGAAFRRPTVDRPRGVAGVGAVDAPFDARDLPAVSRQRAPASIGRGLNPP